MHRLKWHYPLPCQNTSTVSSCKLVRTVTASGQNVSILCMNYPLQTDESLSLPQHVISNLQRSYEQMLGYIIKISIITIFSNVVLKMSDYPICCHFPIIFMFCLATIETAGMVVYQLDNGLASDSRQFDSQSSQLMCKIFRQVSRTPLLVSPRRIIRCKQKLGGKQGNHVIHWPCGHGPGALGDVWLMADELQPHGPLRLGQEYLPFTYHDATQS